MSRICEQLVRWFSTWYVCASRPTPIVYHCHKPRVKRTWDGPVVGLTYKSGPFNMGGPFIISDSTVLRSYSTVPTSLTVFRSGNGTRPSRRARRRCVGWWAHPQLSLTPLVLFSWKTGGMRGGNNPKKLPPCLF